MTTPEREKWVRSDNDEWDIVNSVGYTALVAAGWRALHAASPQPLVRDQYAKHFVAASADRYLTGLLASPGTSEGAGVLPRLNGVQVRFFDEFFRSASDGGVRQAVIIAAGLDCRAYRLAWPVNVTVFEVDQPKVLDFKARVLAELGASPTARRQEVAADLRDDWPIPLRASGFDIEKPTAWSLEGVLPFLTGAAQDVLFTRIDQLSAPGSKLAAGAFGSQFDKVELSALEETYPGVSPTAAVDFSGLIYDRDNRTNPADWLAEHGWTIDDVSTNPELQAGYGGTVREVDQQVDSIIHSQYITATRGSIQPVEVR
jgi:methyltransferase (TIGR00027 family)